MSLLSCLHFVGTSAMRYFRLPGGPARPSPPRDICHAGPATPGISSEAEDTLSAIIALMEHGRGHQLRRGDAQCPALIREVHSIRPVPALFAGTYLKRMPTEPAAQPSAFSITGMQEDGTYYKASQRAFSSSSWSEESEVRRCGMRQLPGDCLTTLIHRRSG